MSETIGQSVVDIDSNIPFHPKLYNIAFLEQVACGRHLLNEIYRLAFILIMESSTRTRIQIQIITHDSRQVL